MYDNELGYDEYSNFGEYKLKRNTKSFKFNKKFFLIIGVLLVLIIGFSVYNNHIKYRKSYAYIEDRLEEEAKKYVRTNNLQSSRAFYIESNKLNVELKSGCYSLSGVLVEDDNYQAYLICSNYETKVNNYKNEYIKLNGREIVFLNQGNQYVETYYELLSDVKVNIESNVGTEEGVYDVNYMVIENNSIVERITKKVIVLDNQEIESLKPKITLNGDEIEYIELNTNYVEKGANGFDKDDGIISDIKINGEVNINKEGEYNLNYIAINSKGYASSITRKVIVVSNDVGISVNYIASPRNLTNSSVSITLAIYGDSYDYTLLPNNETSYDKVIQYEVSENNNYSFKINDKNGNIKEEVITIENIDTEKPSGTCSGYYLDNKSYITVDAKDNLGISKYVVNGTRYNSNEIILDGEIKDISVSIYDNAGNYIDISCQLEDRNPITSACNDKTIYPGHHYTFTQEQKEKMAAMVSAEADGNPREAVDYLGMKLVASHMCNYYEIINRNNKEKWTGAGLHKLISTGTWYAELTKNSKYNPNNERHKLALQAVEEVMVNGNRILPHYIDEFDMFPEDVKNPLSNVEEYVRDETIYYGVGWIKVTFYCINIGPDGEGGNIFGYTNSMVQKPAD